MSDHPREEDGEQQRQAGAGGGGEGGGGVDRRVRVPAQAPGGQPLPGALPGNLSHSITAQIRPAMSSSVTHFLVVGWDAVSKFGVEIDAVGLCYRIMARKG